MYKQGQIIKWDEWGMVVPPAWMIPEKTPLITDGLNPSQKYCNSGSSSQTYCSLGHNKSELRPGPYQNHQTMQKCPYRLQQKKHWNLTMAAGHRSFRNPGIVFGKGVIFLATCSSRCATEQTHHQGQEQSSEIHKPKGNGSTAPLYHYIDIHRLHHQILFNDTVFTVVAGHSMSWASFIHSLL